MKHIGGQNQRITEWMVISQLRVEGLNPPDHQIPEMVAAGQVLVPDRRRQEVSGVPHVRLKRWPTRGGRLPISLFTTPRRPPKPIRDDDNLFELLPRRHEVNEGVFVGTNM